MHSHLEIKVNGKSLVLPDDLSLSVEEKNPLFNDVTFFSYPMQLPVEGNREVLKNIADRNSSMRAMDLEHADARILADGLPLNHGQVITQDNSEIKSTFDFNIDAQQQSFSDLIGDLECRDVRVKDDLCIGEQIGKIAVRYNYTAQLMNENMEVYYVPRSGSELRELAKSEKTAMVEIEAPQALGFSIPAKCVGFPAAQQEDGKPVIATSYINVSQPYGSTVNSPYVDASGATLGWPFCNSRVAYAHPDVKKNDDGTMTTEGTVKGNDKGTEKEDYGQYWCLDANRPQSGICFYVLYFLDCLFEQLGVVFDKTELMAVEDLKRLCFVTTQCHYDLRATNQQLRNLAEINEWLSSRNCGAEVHPQLSVKDKTFDLSVGMAASIDLGYIQHTFYKLFYRLVLSGGQWTTSSIYEMYANSDNFPEASVSSVISALENSFGIRFLYDPETKIVKAKLLRNFYQRTAPKEFEGEVLQMIPITEKITGVRMAYSAESDSKEQKKNVRYGVKDYDTSFNYIEFPPERTQENPNGRTITTDIYNDIVKQVSAMNMNVYVDKTTGNAYRVKIDSEAEDLLSLRPILFQVGQFKGVEMGDCSEQHKDYVKEYVSEFQPLAVTLINAKEYNNDNLGNVSPVYAPLLDVEMEHEYLPKDMKSLLNTDDFFKDRKIYLRQGEPIDDYIEVALLMTLKLAESYDPTQTDTGNSPLQDLDWGLTIGVMRGGGSGSEVVDYDRGYDGFDNSRWKDTIAIYEMTADSLDLKGAVFDYNGTSEGVGSGERFSLAIRSWVQPEWADAPLCNDDERDPQGHIITKIRSRGLCDTFMREHFYALLNRKPYKVKVLATIAQLLDIRNHWGDWYVIDGKVGYIDKVSYQINRATGIQEAELMFYSV